MSYACVEWEARTMSYICVIRVEGMSSDMNMWGGRDVKSRMHVYSGRDIKRRICVSLEWRGR